MNPDPVADPDPAIFVSDLQDVNKKLVLLITQKHMDSTDPDSDPDLQHCLSLLR